MNATKLLEKTTTAIQAGFLSHTARSVRREHLTYLSVPKLLHLEKTLRQIEERQIPGDFLEFGIALDNKLGVRLAGLQRPDRLTQSSGGVLHHNGIRRNVCKANIIQNRQQPALVGGHHAVNRTATAVTQVR